MTDIQVKYLNYNESVRHNLATESQAQAELAERNRSNLVNERIATESLQESIRHNTATEGETYRHNVATESLGDRQLAETIRFNKANQKENKRHNVAGEKETKRHNLATEKETKRSNKASESISVTRNDLTRALNASNISLNQTKIDDIINDMSRAGVNNLTKSGNPINSTTGLVLELVDIISNPKTSSAQKQAAEKALQKVYDSADGKSAAVQTWKDIVAMGKQIAKKKYNQVKTSYMNNYNDIQKQQESKKQAKKSKKSK